MGFSDRETAGGGCEAQAHNESMRRIYAGIRRDRERGAREAFDAGDLDGARRYADAADGAEARAGEFAGRNARRPHRREA